MDASRDQERTIGIIADDLTSAADGAGPFVAAGHPALVTRGLAAGSPAVLSVDTNSRSLAVSDAVAGVTVAAGALAARSILYKTVDSTLRGHVAAEMAAALAASGRDRVVFAPAFPDAGRITRGGRQFVDGQLVSDSAYGADPVHPVGTSVLADFLPPGMRAEILDAESQAELMAKIRSVPDPDRVLFVGSPGMARALADLVGPGPTLSPSREPVQRVMVVAGSANPLSHRQVEKLRTAAGALNILTTPTARAPDPVAVLSDLVARFRPQFDAFEPEALIATGGETMGALLQNLSVNAFELLGEISPGFPYGRVRLPGRPHPILIGLKAGGFGGADALVHAVGFFQRGAS